MRGRYDIILIDPPWKYATSHKHFPCLPTKEIGTLVDGILTKHAASDSMLFLWSTCPFLPAALELIELWGYRYITTAFIWIKITKSGKPNTGKGVYTNSNGELVLLARRGKWFGFAKDQSINSVVLAPRGRHSQKPGEVMDKIERMYPDARRLELFARERRRGWSAWGNEIK